MPDRSALFTAPQLGLEVTAGTGVAANRKLSGLSIQPAIKYEGQSFRPNGNRYATFQASNKEWTESELSGAPLYDELPYIFHSLIKIVTPTQIIPSTGIAYQYVYTSSQSSSDTPQTYTVEQGDSTRAHKFAYGLITGYTLSISRESVEHSGTMMGQRLEDSITLTGSPTSLPLIPVLPTQFSVYLSDSQGGLAGASAITRALSVEWSLEDRYGPIWALNAANTSWAAHIETEPKLTTKLMLEADATGMGLLTQLRSGATKWMRVKATGDIIEASTPYTFQIDMPLKVNDVSEFTDEGGLFAIEWSFTGVHDSTWNKPFELTVINKTAAL